VTDLTQHWRLAFDNKFMGAWNLWDAKNSRYTTATLKIADIREESVTMQGGRKERATLCYLLKRDGSRGKAPLILTKKMGRAIATMYGPIPAGWIGKEITLYVEVGFKTKDGPADVLRIKNSRAGDSMKDAMRDEPLPEPPEMMGDDDAAP
jgi:hypothetical protein